MPQPLPTIADIKGRLASAGAREFAAIERALADDTRKGVRSALDTARRRLDAQRAEGHRLASLYSYEAEVSQGRLAVGLDEVGRGPLAGPLTVGAVVLAPGSCIPGLNDSKQIAPARREAVAQQVRHEALAWAVEHVEAAAIDAAGMTASLRYAFLKVIGAIEAQGVEPGVVLLDGNPLHLDPREVNVVKGDARCASIAAASVIAKVERDALMCRLAQDYPAYGFDSCKGYASAGHIEAIRTHGLSPVHRRSFCTAFTQESLF